jgi:hypothetical protein
MESIVLARMRPQIRRELKPELSWSLSLLASHYPPDDTGYWLLCFKAYNTWTKIAKAYPAEDWDASSMQMRVGGGIPRECYAVGKFRFIDTIFQVSMTVRPDIPGANETEEFATLLVGRQADHRRMSPQPWCRFLDHPIDFSRAAEIASSYQRRSITRGPEADASLTTYRHQDVSVMASVKAKEISGVFYYVISVLPVEQGTTSADMEMLLCNSINFDSVKETSTGVHILKF